MKLINNLLFTLSTTFLLCMAVEVRAEEKLQVAQCQSVVARILSSGDQAHAVGRLLCARDKLRPVQNQQPIIICYNPPNLLRGGKDKVGRLCSPRLNGRQSHDSFDYFKGRGSIRAEGKPSLIQPFGVMVLQSRPRLVWNPIQGATHYSISVEAFNGEWELVVSSGNSLSYPQAWPDMEPGNLYKFTIFAYKDKMIISSDTSKIILLSKKKMELVNEAVALARQLPLSSIEEAIELDAIYMSEKLLHNSIGALESLRESGQSNPQLDRLLADRYIQSGQPELADPILKELQLPTKIKFPQR
ncbi:hypothetical protein ACSYAD_24830 [Acaryochloris marina NIES-2412]|uniref:hypothetical protein n=1 Tax=Acaryochloris marina TaxID=155978 RepID=UPI00405895BA